MRSIDSNLSEQLKVMNVNFVEVMKQKEGDFEKLSQFAKTLS